MNKLAAVLSELTEALEAKVRRVRTPAGQRRFGQPIGSVIVRDDAPPLRNLFAMDGERVRDVEGNTYTVERDGDTYVARDRRGREVVRGADEEDTYELLNDHVPPWTDTGQPKQIGTNGMHLASPAEREEMSRVIGKAIPPAWTDVHVADDPSSARVLVKGKDAKGRWQTIYSAAHTEGQAEAKFKRNQALVEHLDKLDSALARDSLDDDSAAALLMIRRLGMRPGSNSNTGAEVQAHGATNLLARHASISDDGELTLDFTGKKGVHIVLKTRDPEVVAAVRARLEAGREGDQQLFDTNENRVRQYMRTTGGVPEEFLLKDLRTLRANVVALQAIERRGDAVPRNQNEFRRWRREVAVEVSAQLGNTPTLALNSYINPTVFARWQVDPSWT